MCSILSLGILGYGRMHTMVRVWLDEISHILFMHGRCATILAECC